jgi:outer membrane immunogenic protein
MPLMSKASVPQAQSVLAASGLLALLLTCATPAAAADYLPFKAPPYRLATPQWAGAYFGLQGGYVWGKDTTHEYFTATGASTGLEWTYDVKSAVGGAHAGYNFQFGNVVLGIEADLELAHLRGGFSDQPVPPLNPGGTGTTEIDWQGSLRGRVGYSFDRVMIYGTAGLAFARIEHVYTNLTTLVSESTARVRTGWTAGVGLEYSITPSMTTRIEYRYSDYGNYFYDSTTAFPGLTGEQRPRFHAMRIGLSYRY